MVILAIILDPDEMLHNVAFHQDLHCLLSQNQYSEKEILYFGEETMDHPDFFLTFMGNSYGTKSRKRVNQY